MNDDSIRNMNNPIKYQIEPLVLRPIRNHVFYK